MKLLTLLSCAALWVSCAVVPKPPEYPHETLESGVIVHDLAVPEKGEVASRGDHVAIEYELALEDGSTIDSSAERGQPVRFEIGVGEVPRGLEEGVMGMRLFGQREIRVPPELGYGSEGLPPRIPPGAWLHFQVELIAIGYSP